VEHQLHQAWLLQQGTKGLNFRRLQMVGSNNETGVSLMRKSYLLRQRMLHFLENYIHYMLYEVVEPNWHIFIGNISDTKMARNVDDLIKLHSGYQDTCLKECLLTNIDLLEVLHKILTTCLKFETLMMETFTKVEDAKLNILSSAESASNTLDEISPRNVPSKKDGKYNRQKVVNERANQESDILISIITTETYNSNVTEIEKEFDLSLGKFMQMIWLESRNQYHTYLVNLSTRLDYNGYLAARYGKDRNTYY